MAAGSVARSDPWDALRAATPARIGLGRIGDTVPLRSVLDFQRAHAAARDAVHAALDVDAIRTGVAPHPTCVVNSAAVDRAEFLRRPDLGRTLAPAAHQTLEAEQGRGSDCVFVIADGLSATAVERHAPPLFALCKTRLTRFRLAPVVVATQARVALGDAVGASLGARLSVVLIGERPGLSVADSLGAYITYGPRVGRRDFERNCVSNIHGAGGLDYPRAASILCWLVEQALARELTGIALKEGSTLLAADG